MKRALSILLVMLVIGCGKIRQAEEPDPREPTYNTEQVANLAGQFTIALVNSEIEDHGKAHVYCTGVWISEKEILTAAHCMIGVTRHLEEQDEEEAPSRDPYNTKYQYITQIEENGINKEPKALHRAKLVNIDIMHDLALIKGIGDIPNHKFAKIADEVPELGNHVVMVGHPRELYWSFAEGVISAIRSNYPVITNGPFIQINGTVWFGNSGGGAFDKHGYLIGIASFIPHVPNMGMYIHRDSIVQFLGR